MRALEHDPVGVLDARPILAAVLALHDAADPRSLALALPVLIADLIPYDTFDLVGDLASVRRSTTTVLPDFRLAIRTASADRTIAGVVLGRRRVFTQRETALAGLLGPHLGAAIDHVRLRTARVLPSGRAVVAALTIREQEVLALVADGRRDRDIAAALHIEPRTVEKHVEHIRTKLGARSRAEAVARWTRALG